MQAAINQVIPGCRADHSRIHHTGNSSKISSLLITIQCCSSSKDLAGGKRAHARAVDSGIDSDIYIATNLINMYVKCGSLVDAYRVFQKMPHRNVVSWTALMLGFARNGEEGMVLELFVRMQAEGCPPNDRTFVVVLKSCASLATKEDYSRVGTSLVKVRSLERGMAVHSLACRCPDIFVLNSLVDMYGNCGSLVDAYRAFCRMDSPDVVSWNSIISAHAENSEEHSALELFARMQAEGCSPNARSFIAALRACAILAENEESQELVDGGIRVKLRTLEVTMAVHSLSEKLLCTLERFVSNSLVDLYSKCGSLMDAQRVFGRMPHRDLVSWNSLMLGYVENDEAATALELFCSISLRPDSRTFVTALKACGSLQESGMTKAIHSEICRSGLEINSLVTNSLMDVYGKCGKLVEAQVVFDSSVIRNTSSSSAVAWNSLISGYSRESDTHKALSLFNEMIKEGFEPTGITFIHILAACSHAGAVNLGKKCFEAMRSRFGVEPEADHYICMVDMLGRVNEMDSAIELVKKMELDSSRSDPVLWKALLSSCQKWENAELGEIVFQKLMKINQVKDPAVYTLMLNTQKGSSTATLPHGLLIN